MFDSGWPVDRGSADRGSGRWPAAKGHAGGTFEPPGGGQAREGRGPNRRRSGIEHRNQSRGRVGAMSAETTSSSLQGVRIADREQWRDGPPHELFKQMRAQCPVHWTDGFADYPEEAGFWSLTRADDVHEVSRDWQTYSSATGVTAITDAIMSVDLVRAMFIGMDPPQHDRLKALFQRGFTPKSIAAHEDG